MSDPVVVLGMHRSGTSFLIRSLNLSGLWLGGDQTLSTVEGRAMPGNPKGNYENRGCIAINDAILRRSGGGWFNPPRRMLVDEEDYGRIQAFCSALEQGCPAGHLRWGWKDPRTILTLEAWLKALNREIFIVASFRHPAAVARSLHARDKMPLEMGYALWAHYNASLIYYLERFPHVLVRFDVDQDELLEQTVRAAHLTGLRTDPAAIASWFDKSLLRSGTHLEIAEPPRELDSLWNSLLGHHRAQFSLKRDGISG
jgi:hypothetical protein